MTNRILELAGILTEMKNGGSFYDRAGNPKDIPGCRSVDHRADPEEVLKEVDAQLKAFGLQVVMYKTGGDDYTWAIVKK